MFLENVLMYMKKNNEYQSGFSIVMREKLRDNYTVRVLDCYQTHVFILLFPLGVIEQDNNLVVKPSLGIDIEKFDGAIVEKADGMDPFLAIEKNADIIYPSSCGIHSGKKVCSKKIGDFPHTFISPKNPVVFEMNIKCNKEVVRTSYIVLFNDGGFRNNEDYYQKFCAPKVDPKAATNTVNQNRTEEAEKAMLAEQEIKRAK
ncbi:hypothetical protein K502DRAFT_351215 [Neoconidiobolus thromboides FSU 785]|nr:hypothetical protein K502DRAFT_351215 [Neoconidiobolus thromboides FSU 785]